MVLEAIQQAAGVAEVNAMTRGSTVPNIRNVMVAPVIVITTTEPNSPSTVLNALSSLPWSPVAPLSTQKLLRSAHRTQPWLHVAQPTQGLEKATSRLHRVNPTSLLHL